MYVFAIPGYHVKLAGPWRCAEATGTSVSGSQCWDRVVHRAEEVVVMVADVAVVAEFAMVMDEIAVVIADRGPRSACVERNAARQLKIEHVN